ncbi:TPA: hypothetical protein HA259_01035 [Thermoplasmata archaeon]|nr:hypothetical protein [Thermoplasmata archaeon]
MNVADIFRRVNDSLSGGRLRASYHPYKELKHTWRVREGVLCIKVSDYLKGVPDGVMESLAWHLLCRAHKMQCPSGASRPYRDHIRTRQFWEPRRRLYLSRGKNISFRPAGTSRDLEEVFSYVNSFYFGGRLERPDLAWLRESPKTRMGLYHPPLRILAVNRVLDSDRVPRYVLEFVMYHELLHDTVEYIDGPSRRTVHTKEFRLREREFTRYDEAQKWLSRIVGDGSGCSEGGLVPQA